MKNEEVIQIIQDVLTEVRERTNIKNLSNS
jgi:hypothetical protein